MLVVSCSRRKRGEVNVSFILLGISVLVLIYLVYVLLNPEQF
ncbi:K(+)-transporting ATPase subunit F [Priestia megaterium]|nr:K(+)-transporting ATPase subunit F [Priestia aryabhattai]